MKSGLVQKALLLRFSAGEPEAYHIIFDVYSGPVRQNIAKIIYQQDIADDIHQEVFIRLWENRTLFQDADQISGWLFRVSYNLSVDHIRKAIRQKYMETEAGQQELTTYTSLASIQASALRVRLLEEAIKELPERKREVLTLCKLQGKTYTETSKLLGISHATVKGYLVESKRFIAKFINDKLAKTTIG